MTDFLYSICAQLSDRFRTLRPGREVDMADGLMPELGGRKLAA